MVLSDVIRMADEIKPNAFPDPVKVAWLNEAEGMVQTEVMLVAVEDVITYTWAEDQGTELLVRPPHDKLYWTYLTAMIDFANGEYNKYQNTMQLFNAYFGEYMRWFAERYRPADGEDVQGWPGYYITAYGIAVKHGFAGTEEEWVASLQGESGETVEFRYDEASGMIQWKPISGDVWTDLVSFTLLQDDMVAKTIAEAQDAADEAALAADAAEEAQAAAEKAQNAAESAASGAESAKSGAESAAESASQYASSAGSSASSAATERAAAQTARAGAQSAQSSAESAAQSAQSAASDAAGSASEAAGDAQDADASAAEAKSWAVGGTGTRDGEDTDNAKYWSEQARLAAGGGVSSFNGRAGAVMPQSGDYTAAMVGASKKATAFTVTLSASAWSSGKQTVSDSRFLSSGYAYTVTPASGSFAAYAKAQIYAEDVSSDGTMVFVCAGTVPSAALTVNILRLEAEA